MFLLRPYGQALTGAEVISNGDTVIFANILHRKTRTGLSAAGVATGVILVILTAGLVNGFLSRQGRRNAAVSAELMARPAGRTFGLGFELSATPSLPSTLLDELRSVEGVSDAVPVVEHLDGAYLIDGIEYDSFTKVSDARMIAGRPAASGNEVTVDDILQRRWNLALGDEIELLNRRFKVVGVYGPESLGRFKVPLSTLQSYLNRPGLSSMILIKVSDPGRETEVAGRIRDLFPQLDIIHSRDLPHLFARGTPALNTFLNVVVALAALVSCLVILLSMHTTVIERTRQIGILKSLGASRLWIMREVEKEALLISMIGVIAGFAISALAGEVIERVTVQQVELQARWFAYTLMMSVGSAAIGALYPAFRAAAEDPVKALSLE